MEYFSDSKYFSEYKKKITICFSIIIFNADYIIMNNFVYSYRLILFLFAFFTAQNQYLETGTYNLFATKIFIAIMKYNINVHTRGILLLSYHIFVAKY